MQYAGYTEEDIVPVFKLMVDYLRQPVAHEAFFKKYASKKFLKGVFRFFHLHLLTKCADPSTASILTRSWAKRNASYFLDMPSSSSPLAREIPGR